MRAPFHRTYCDTYQPPLEVHFAHAEPAYAPAYADVFRTTVRFGAPHNAFVLSREQLDAKLTRSNPEAHSKYERHAEDLLSRVRSGAGRHERMFNKTAEGCFPSQRACAAWMFAITSRYSDNPRYNDCRAGYQPGAPVRWVFSPLY